MFEYKATQAADHALVKLEGALTIYTAAELRRRFKETFAAAPGLVVDLGGVEEADTAGMQLLIFLKREGARAGKPIMLVNHPAPIVRILDLYGLVGRMGDRVKIASDKRDQYFFHYGTKRDPEDPRV